ncbi:MAG: hypothetical protein JW913_10515 [Chitinispirillaceae bacterium]|nr:hypothetical protein [Chitinispirillaceae bacterium]
MFQYVLTPAAGKRLIGKAVARQLSKEQALEAGFIVIIAGTTNGYIAEELLALLGKSGGFSRRRFFRGITTPPAIKTTGTGRLPDESRFPGDIILEKGALRVGKTIYDVADLMKEGDVIVKGVNCIDCRRRMAGILIGHPEGGTIIPTLRAVVGKRVKLLLPAGLEKRISDDIDTMANMLNASGCSGTRLLPVPGEVITEIEALRMLTGASARLVAAGGVCGAEGAIWLAIDGEKGQLEKARELLDVAAAEPLFSM